MLIDREDTDMGRTVRNYDDVIDSRDVIERIDELITQAQAAFEESEDYRDGEELTPADRYLFLDAEDLSELTSLERVAEQAESASDWSYGEQLIRDDYFVEYIKQLVDDCYETPAGFESGEVAVASHDDGLGRRRERGPDRLLRRRLRRRHLLDPVTTMRTIITETDVYTYDELDDDAKARVREVLNGEAWEDGWAQESVSEAVEHLLTEAGWTYRGDLTFALYVQHDDPAWDGDFEGWEFEGRTYNITTTSTYRGNMAVTLEDVTDDGGDSPDEYGIQRDDETWEQAVARAERVEDAAKDFVRTFRWQVRDLIQAEDDHFGSDEYARDMCEANEWEWTEDGERA